MIGVEFLIKLLAGTAFFAFLIYCAQRPHPLAQRAAGMLLTFPTLNGIGLVMTDTSQTALKASAMFAMVAFNGLMMLGFILNFERLVRIWRRPRPVALAFAATAVWALAVMADFSIPPEWQWLCIGAYSVLGLWLTVGFLPDQSATEAAAVRFWQRTNVQRIALFALLLSAVLVVGLWPEHSALTGQLSTFPLPGIFGLVVICGNSQMTMDDRIRTLHNLRSTVLLGPIVAMAFVTLLWPHVGHRHWTWETALLLVPAWIACLVAIFGISKLFEIVEARTR